MYVYKGKTALITGASNGIGAAFAHSLAARGMNVVLVARTEDKLHAIADELSKKYEVRAEVIVADLSGPGIAQTIYQTTQERGLEIDLLVNNAGFSTYGKFETISPASEQAEIMVNVANLVDLTHAFVPAMLMKGEGAVINVASVGSFMAMANQAVYGATKAFVLSFSEGLWVEYRKRGIKVFALCPGGTETGFADVANVDVLLKLDSPEKVVENGLKAFERGRHFAVSGAMNYMVAGILPRLLPRSVFVRLFNLAAKQMMKPRAA